MAPARVIFMFSKAVGRVPVGLCLGGHLPFLRELSARVQAMRALSAESVMTTGTPAALRAISVIGREFSVFFR
jgi:hypothetical protein